MSFLIDPVLITLQCNSELGSSAHFVFLKIEVN